MPHKAVTTALTDGDVRQYPPEIGSEAWIVQRLAQGLPPEETDGEGSDKNPRPRDGQIGVPRRY